MIPNSINVTIRPMTIEDYDAVYALWLSCKGMGLNDVDDAREGIARYLKRNPATSFVALAGDAVVGVIMAGHDGRRGYIYHTAVSPEYRHGGIAARLVDRAMQALTDEGITKAALVVFDRNQTGNAFWEAQGFARRDDLVYRNRQLADMTRIDT